MHGSPSSTTPRGTPSRRGRSPRFSSDNHPQPGSSSLPTSQSNKHATTFTSSLDIPVQGAIPIETESNKSSAADDPSKQPSVESKRAPRKSKTDALAALNTQARSSSTGPDDMEFSEIITEKYRNAPPIPVSPKLDLSTVKTSSSRVPANVARQPRPFGLTDCPEYHPTTEEFRDPMAYIKSISPEAKQYGICKIIPPEEWKMPFVTDTESFRFKTRLQRLNSIEASSRAKLNFLEQLYQYHKQQGNSRVVVPTINHKPLDLWLLRKEVQRLGGYDAVVKGKKWSDLGRILGYRNIPGLSTQIKNSYTRVILPYERFRAQHPVMSPPRDSLLEAQHTETKPSHLSATASSTEDASLPASPLTTTSSPLSEPPDESDANGKTTGSKLRRSTRMGSQEQSPRKSTTGITMPSPVPAPIFYDREKPNMNIGTPEVRNTNQTVNISSPTIDREQQDCEICHKVNHADEMLLCDGCDCGFHTFCLDPPLDSVPKDSQWFCSTCLSGTGGDFGFDEGEEHSLSSFQARDKEFRRLWFESHPPPNSDILPDQGDITQNRIGNLTVSEYDVENEFWRLVQSPDETVEIEYGADVHSTTHGSAMPTLEAHPLNPYAKDPWNLNNIPILPESLLRFIKSDISGMTVPWTYVGMAFSTFCWHNEDHYTYSINYMHWGETKTWYGIPGEDAEKFEAAIKSEAPDLFEAQPDLLFQLVTLMNPELVKKAGVRVYACNQRAREFVVTFPKAYHAGFNHGFNFNEAVNFALPDWLSLGRDCVQRYREHRKLPVFSHDELLITITEQSQSIKTAMWLIDSLKEMVDREMADRQKARDAGLPSVLRDEDLPEEQYQCNICKAFCYLSQVTCPCSTKVVCADHADLLCDNHSPNHLTFRKRFSDDDLLNTYKRFADRAAVPSQWQSKLSRLLSESARPSLRSLRAMLAEGERINFPLAELASLRKCVNKANEWIDSVNSFIVRKQSRQRSRRTKSRQSVTENTNNPIYDPGDRPDRGLDDLYGLIREVETLGFDTPEIAHLRSLAESAEETKLKAAALLDKSPTERQREDFLQECKRLLIDGSSLNVLLDELTEVEKIVDREQLLNELREKLEDPDSNILLDEVRNFLTRAHTCGLPDDNKYLQMLNSRQREGNDWEARARRVLSQDIKTIEDLDSIANIDTNTPVDQDLLSLVETASAKAHDFDKQAKAWLAGEPSGSKARLADVSRLASRATKDFSITSVTQLKRSADIAQDLETRCENVLRNNYCVAQDEDVFQAIGKWKIYADEHLSMFLLPKLEQVEAQLRFHEKWVKDIPWYCPEHHQTHSEAVLEDVLENTRPEDDFPPPDEFFTCICNMPVKPPVGGALSDAVQCDHCFARFHGECAKNGGSCPFCDHQHWNGTIHKQRSFHFCFLPTILSNAPEISKNYSEDYKQLEIIVHRVDRLSAVIGQFLSYTSVAEHQLREYIPQVRHYMRKLYKIQFAVSPNPDISFGLDLAGLHRILAGRPQLARPRKRRKPRFTFGQDIDQDAADHTRCICRGKNNFLLGYPVVDCESCSRRYHIGCVFYPPHDRNRSPSTPRFTCPICCLRKGKAYQYSDIRVVPGESLLPHERPNMDMYVDTKTMLETFSKKIILKKLASPNTHTLFVELVNFQAGSDEGTSSSTTPSSNTSVSAPAPRPAVPHINNHHPMGSTSSSSSLSTSGFHKGHFPPPHNNSVPMFQPSLMPPSVPVQPPPLIPPTMTTPYAPIWTPNPNAPPPPPWSRWGTMSTPAMPPSTQRRNGNNSSATSNGTGTPQPGSSSSRKRKNLEDHPSSNHRPSPQPQQQQQQQQQQSTHGHPPPPPPLPRPEEDARPMGSPYPSKRHAGPSLTPTPHSPPRPVQTLSPSLAMIVSPTNQAVHTTSSPRGSNQLPPLRNGTSGSPLLPPVKSLISGEPRPL